MSGPASIVLAVDLGKTGCRVALRRNGIAAAEAVGEGAPGLAASGGAMLAEAAVLAVAAPLLGGVPVDAACVAAAGAMAAPGAAHALAARLAASLPAGRVAVCSDATATHAGALGGAPGVVLAIGTGAVAIGVAADGAVHRGDGWGPWLGDEGSGAWLGMHGLRAALRAWDGRGEPTALQEAAERGFGPLVGLAAAVEGHGSPPRFAARFAPAVAEAATAGDAVASRLLDRAADHLAAAVRSAAAGLPCPAPLAIAGGLAGMAPLVRRVHERLAGTVQPILPRGTALDGAALLATATATVHEAAVHRATAGEAGHSLDRLATEGIRPGLDDLDLRSPGDVTRLVLDSERDAHAALLRAAPALARAADAVAARMGAGGRLFYLGAGTPGRLATLDAAELGPTYSAPPGLVIPLLAGGPDAMIHAVEGAEDDAQAAAAALDAHRLTADDAVVGIAASGRTPYVVGGLAHARAAGALTVAIVNNPGSPAASAADIAVEILTGAELVAGSTRMTAGTTQKIALNALSTAAMIALGRTYGARMVDVRATNAKLQRRALRMTQEITGASEAEAQAALAAAGGRVKPALVALLAGVSPAEADTLLERNRGRVRDAIASKGD